MPSPNPGPTVNDLYGVSAASSNDAWAVGDYAPPGGGSDTLIEQWNGTQWSVIPSPNPGQQADYLYGVAAISSGAVWAAGNVYVPRLSHTQTLIEQWNGAQWHKVKSPSPGAFANQLFSVSALSPNNAWAVGVYLTNSQTVFTLTEHWNGSRWKVVASPSPGPDHLLRGVSQAPRDQRTGQAWAVGYYNNGSVNQTLIEFYCS